jgi:phosphohistidine phosphatase SixA
MNLFCPTRRPKQLSYSRLFAAPLILLLLSFEGAGVIQAQQDFKVSTVYLVRHAERAAAPAQDPPLAEAGNVRSQELARMLAKAGIKAIYTSQYLRTRQTAEPLAKQLGIMSDVVEVKMSPSNPREVSKQSYEDVAKKVYAREGEATLIIGHSNTVPEMIKALGGDAAPIIDEKEYDDLFIVTIYAKGKAKVAQLKYGKQP